MSSTICGVASGPTSVVSSSGSPTRERLHRRDESLLERVRDRSCTMKRFAAMHDWPLLTMRAFTAGRHGLVEIRGRHDDERIAAAELQHAFLMCLAAFEATLAPAGSLPVSVAALTRSSSSNARDLLRAMSSV